MEFAISSHTGNYSTPNKLVGEMEPIAEATLSLIEQESTESTTMTTTSETQPVVANNNDHSLIVSMPDDEEDDIPARTTPPQLYNGSLQNLRRPTGAEQTVTYRESNHATSIHTSNPHKTKQHPQNHNKHGNHSSPNVTMTPSSATAPSHQPMVVSPSSPPTGRSYDPNGDGTMMVIDSPVASPILMNLTHSPPNNDNNINKSDERIDDMSTIVPCDDQNETADETMTSTQLDILEHHKRHLRRHAAGSDSPEALLGRLQQQHSQQSWNSHGTRHHNMMAMVVDKDPHDENEGLISRRLQEIECKKVALHQKRICLEQRLCDFVDSEKRMRVLAGNTTLSGSMSSSLLMTSNTMARSSQSLALSRSSQSSGGSPSVHSLLKPPIPSPRKVLQQQQQQQQRQSSFICQNGDQMVQDYLWKDPRTKKITYRYSGPLNKQKVPQGWGVMRFLDGQVYEGQIYNGYRWGMGTNKWPDGQVYIGEWDDHSRNGRGTHSWKDGRRVNGHWLGGHLNGRAIFTWPNGASYDGECRKGKKHGRGTHTWANGKLYKGSYVNGKEEGFGSLTQGDWKYRGQFKAGKREGYGMQIWRDKTYDGEWSNNKAHGKGRIVWQNGATYTGEFKHGRYHGLGVYHWPNGKKYVGSWHNGCKHGQGVYTWPSGKKYDGTYKDGLKDGYGRMAWPDGRMYCGSFCKGKREGRGIQTNADGSMVHCGLWKNDAPYIKGETPSPSTSMSSSQSKGSFVQGASAKQDSAQNTSDEDIVFMESQPVAVADDSHVTARSSSALKAAAESANKELFGFAAHSKSAVAPTQSKYSDSLVSTVKTIPATPSKMLDDVSSMGGSFDLDQKEPTCLLGSFERISV